MARSGRSDQASVVAKQSVTREQFVKTTETDRAKLGKMSSRKVAGITRSIFMFVVSREWSMEDT